MVRIINITVIIINVLIEKNKIKKKKIKFSFISIGSYHNSSRLNMLYTVTQ